MNEYPQWVMDMRAAVENFVHRVEIGEVRSVKTYEKFKEILAESDKEESQTQLTELEYLREFFSTADFGPAESDVRDIINEEITNRTGKELPAGYGPGEE